MLIAWDEGGNVIATCDQLVGADATGAKGFVDMAGHEASGQRMRMLWNVNGAVASGAWPEHLGGRVHEFRVEWSPGLPLIDRLVHKVSGHVRERSAIEAAVEAGERSRWDILGTPDKPLHLDAEGATI
jgi:hypothetical protein